MPRNISDLLHLRANYQWVRIANFNLISFKCYKNLILCVCVCVFLIEILIIYDISESGIIADISTSPDNEVQTSEDTSWMKTTFTHQKSLTENSIQKGSTSNTNVTQRLVADNANPYINNDSMAVHL